MAEAARQLGSYVVADESSPQQGNETRTFIGDGILQIQGNGKVEARGADQIGNAEIPVAENLTVADTPTQRAAQLAFKLATDDEANVADIMAESRNLGPAAAEVSGMAVSSLAEKFVTADELYKKAAGQS